MKRLWFVVIAVAVGLAALVWWRADPGWSIGVTEVRETPSDIGRVQAGDDEPGHARADRVADDAQMRIDQAETKSAQPSPDTHATLTESLASAPDLTTFIDRAANHGGWGAMEATTNAAPWQLSCAVAFKRNTNLLPDASAPDAIASFAARFDEFCNEFSLKQTARFEPDSSQDDIDAFLLGAADRGTWVITRQFPDWQEMLEQSGRSRVLDAAIDRLDQSLANLDEMDVASILKFITGHGLIKPPIPDDSRDTSGLYRGVLAEAAAILFCEEIGGCKGADHPVVLRQCVIRLDRGVGCHRPGGIHDAIHQTLTPLQHQAFLSLLDQVRSLRASHG